MYAFIDFICFILGIAGIAVSCVFNSYIYIIAAVGWIIFYPFLNELIYNIFASCSEKIIYEGNWDSRIVYSEQYNLSLLGIEKLHPFDSCKYRRIYQKLIQRNVIHGAIKPQRISRSLLLQVVSKWLLLKLNYTLLVCKYIQLPLIFLPSFLGRWRILNPMLAATQGSILSSLIAKKKGWAINLSGGFHHSTKEYGGGFCIYPDITICVHYLRSRLGIRKILIIDLDAHQGNGYERDLIDDKQIFIADFYNARIYPHDTQAKKAIKKQVRITSSMTDRDYLRQLQCIEEIIIDFKPEFIIYNAGTDILSGDPLGRLNITSKGIIDRDEYIFKISIKYSIPVNLLLSGGYMKQNAEIIAESIQNIYKKYDKN